MMDLLFEILFYLSITIFVELAVALALGFYNKKFIRLLVILNLITNPVFTVILYLYRNNFTNDIHILTLLLLEGIVVLVEFFFYKKYFKDKYSINELIFSVVLFNGFSFTVYGFLQDILEYLDMFQ